MLISVSVHSNTRYPTGYTRTPGIYVNSVVCTVQVGDGCCRMLPDVALTTRSGHIFAKSDVMQSMGDAVGRRTGGTGEVLPHTPHTHHNFYSCRCALTCAM